MKKILCIIMCFFLLFTGMITLSQPTDIDYNEFQYLFHIDNLQITQKNNFTQISINESIRDQCKPGHPSLPCFREINIIPYGSIIEKINYDLIKTNVEKISKPLQPFQTPLPLSMDQQTSSLYIPDSTIYNQDSFYPEIPFTITINTGRQNGELVSILTIEYYPVQYNPVTQQVKWTETGHLTITTKTTDCIDESSDAIDLVIICPEVFKKELQNLATHKQQIGIETSIKTTEEIYENYLGRDNEEKIKFFLYDSLQNYDIQYALLVGNVELLPMRETSIEFYNDDSIITDLYYADLYDEAGNFSSWDTNENNKFSEYSWSDGLIDDIDAYPDISIGRLPCKNSKEVKIVVDKIINYEKTTAGQSWFHRLLLMGGDTFPNNGISEGEIVTDLIGKTMDFNGFESMKLWTSQDTFNPLNINKQINKGAGFISYSGHGYEQGFGTSPPNIEERIQYFSPYLIGVFNKNKLPIIFFDACSTTKLDFTVEDALYWYPEPLARFFTFLEGDRFEMGALFPCFSWQLVKKQNGGSISAIGATRVAFTGVNANGPHWGAGYLNSRFFENYQPGKLLGNLFNDAQFDYLNHIGKELITLEEFNLIGDPSLRIGGIP